MNKSSADKSALKIVFLTRNFPGSSYVINNVNKAKNISAILLENRRREQKILNQSERIHKFIRKIARNPFYNFKSLLIKILTQIEFNPDKLYKKMLYGSDNFLYNNAIPLFRVDYINSVEALKILKTIQPDLILVFGTGILKKHIIECSSMASVNLHTGIVPYYRGVMGEFFALYNNDFNNIGYTLHFVTEKLDAGDIILQEKIKMKFSDNHITLRIKNLKSCVNGFIRVIDQFEKGVIEALPQKINGRLYTSADLNEKKYLKVFIDCILRKYITKAI